VRRSGQDDHLLALLLEHGHGLAAGHGRGGDGRPGIRHIARPHNHQVTSNGDSGDRGNRGSGDGQQNAITACRPSFSGASPPVF
jgi:hypothetical protein